jgi:tetratricopeptide (TPR) repeat protein
VTLSKQEQALASAQQAVAWKEQAQEGQQGIEGETLGYLVWGQALRRMGQNQEARRYLEHVLELCHRYPPTDRLLDWLPEIESRAYGWLCSIALNPLYDHTAARTYAEQKVQLARKLGKRHAEIVGLSDLADIALAVGNYPNAQRYYEQVLDQARKFGNRTMEAISLDRLGRIMQLQGHYEPGYRLFEAALAIFRAMSNTIGEFSTLNALIHLSTLMGAYSQAQAWCEQSLHISQSVEPPLGEFLDSLLPRTLLAHYTGDSLHALMVAEQSWQIAQRVADPLRMAHALVLIGHVQSDQQPHAAITAYTQALAYYAALHDRRRATVAQAGLAHIALTQGNLAGAQTQVEAILPVLAESHTADVDEPFWVYLTCYRVLAASADPRAATILQAGYELLQKYANYIPEDTLRRSFLENVAAHRELQQSYELTLRSA